MIDFEQELRIQLHRRADAAPARDGWAGIDRRLAIRERSRRTRNACMTVAVVCLLTAGAVALAGRSGTSRVSTDPAGAPDGSLPRLVFRMVGFEPTFATESVEASRPPTSTAAPGGGRRLSIFTERRAGYGGKVLFVTTAAPGVEFGIGDASPTATQVAIGNATGYLQTHTSLPVQTLGWRLPSGQAVYLVGLRLTDDELASIGRALRVDGAGDVTWPAGTPALGLELHRTSDAPSGPRWYSEVTWVQGSDRLSLRLQQGGTDVLDDLIADRAASAREIGEIAVEGAHAVMATSDAPAGAPGSTSVMWQVRDGVVAELVGEGAGRAHVVTAAASLVEVSEAEWQALLARMAQAPAEPPAGPPEGAAIAAACSLRGAWLGAAATADAAMQAKLLDDLRRLRDTGTVAGWGSRGDILVVLGQLADAMAAGDVATVRSTPAGGCP
jgi:hypothetical protein